MEHEVSGMPVKGNALDISAGATDSLGAHVRRGMAALPDILAPYIDNPYVKTVASDGSFYYTDGFYEAMSHKLDEGMKSVEAYLSMGFDVDVLGTDRAYSAAKRARKWMDNRKPFDNLKPGKYDGSIDVEEALNMFNDGEIDKDEMLSRAIARIAYLSAENKALKKNRGMKTEEGIF